MANVFISNAPPLGLPPAAAITGAEILPMDQTVGLAVTTVKASLATLFGPIGINYSTGDVTITPISGQGLTVGVAADLGGILIQGAQNNVALTLNNTQAGGTANWRMSSSATGSGFGAGNLVFGTGSAEFVVVAPAGGVTILAPTAGNALSANAGPSAVAVSANGNGVNQAATFIGNGSPLVTVQTSTAAAGPYDQYVNGASTTIGYVGNASGLGGTANFMAIRGETGLELVINGGTRAMEILQSGAATIFTPTSGPALTVNSNNANVGPLTANNSAAGGIQLQLFGTSNAAGLKGWAIRVGSTGAFAIDTTSDTGTDLNGGFIMARDASGNVTATVINQNISGNYALSVGVAAVGAKGIKVVNSAGGASMFSYSDGSGSGWTNTDPYTSGSLLYLNGTNMNFYGGGALLAQMTQTGGLGVTGGQSGMINYGTYMRNSPTVGFLEGSYGTIETGATPGCIYTLGGNHYLPTASTLGIMYGIGYTLGNVSGITAQGQPANWGQYIAAAGVGTHWFDASTGTSWQTGYSVVGSGAGNCLYFSGSGIVLGGGGGKVTAQAGGTASGGNPGDIILIY